MIGALARDAGVPVVAEGGIWTPEQLRSVFEAGAHTAVVGSAITRPMLITPPLCRRRARRGGLMMHNILALDIGATNIKAGAL